MLMAAVAYRRKPVLCGGRGGRERGVRKGRYEEGEEEREVRGGRGGKGGVRRERRKGRCEEGEEEREM